MNYADIKRIDVANGVGVRVSLFVSGCTHKCKGCFNSEAWDFNYGKPFTQQQEKEIIGYLAPEYIAGLTLLGGEPMEHSNQRALLPFIEKVKKAYPNKTVWCYSGYTYDKDLLAGGRAHTECTDKLLSLIDVLVDGEFVEKLKNLSLRFKGSANQRIIDLNATRKCGKIVRWDNDESFDALL